MSGLLPPLTTGEADLNLAATAGWALAEGLAAAGDSEWGSEVETIFPCPSTRESLTLQSSNNCLQQTLWGPAMLYRPRGTADVG
jgi:hypothetical protein